MSQDTFDRTAIDQRIKANQQARIRIGSGVNNMRDRLLGAGFGMHRVFELMHPVSELLVGFNYVADECTVTITTPGRDGWRDRTDRVELPVRIYPAWIERDPDLLVRLTDIILSLHDGHSMMVHYDSGGGLIGLATKSLLIGEISHRTVPVELRPQSVDGAVDDRREEAQ